MLLNILLTIIILFLLGLGVLIIILWRRYGKELSITIKEIKNLTNPKGIGNTKDLFNEFNNSLKEFRNLQEKNNKNGKRF